MPTNDTIAKSLERESVYPTISAPSIGSIGMQPVLIV
jgi:hypothetical protein